MNKFVIIVLLFFIISSFGLNLYLYDDEAIYVHFFDFFEKGQYPTHQNQPVLSTTYFFLLWIVEGLFDNLVPIRLFGLIIGALVLLITYKFAAEAFDKKTALLSAAIMALSFYFILASLRTDIDGNILTLFVTLAFYLYYKSTKERSFKWPVLSGLAIGIAILFKYSSVFILVAILGYELFFLKEKKVNRLAVIGGISILFAALFPIITFLIGRADIFNLTLQWGLATSTGFGLEKLPMILAKHLYRIVQYGTPVLFFMPLIAFFIKGNKEKWLFVLWSVLLFFTFVFGAPLGDAARYHMMMIPALAVLTAFSINEIFRKQNIKKLIKIGSVIFLASVLVIVALNLFSYTATPFSFEYFNAELLTKNPDVWYTGTSGPVFNVSLYSLLFASVLSAFLFLAFISAKAEKTRALLIVCLLAASFAFNVFLVEEYLFYGFSPNYSEVMEEMIDYYHENGLEEPVFSIDEDFPYYLGIGWYEYYDLEASENRAHLSDGGTVLYMNLDPTKGSLMWKDVERECELRKVFYSKGYEAGFIFSCPKAS